MTIEIAIEPYDRHLPLIEGAVAAVRDHPWTFKEVGQLAVHRDGNDRHERFLRDGEFQAAELSLSSYLLYRENHDDVTALPIFPRRLFSLSNIWVRHDSSAQSWKDLRGAVIGIPTFQMSLGVVARHDMQAVEGLDWREMAWASSHPENVRLESPVRRIAAASLHDALDSGEIDALLTPEIPSDPAFREGARRLYGARSIEIERRQLRDNGYAPIMHVIGVRTRILQENPALARDLLEAFTLAQEMAWTRYDDPGWGLSFWGRQEIESQDLLSARRHWEHGLEPNRRALEEFRDASFSQGILRSRPEIDTLFAPTA